METKNAGNSAGFAQLLITLFIALKLTDRIDWSWWWALSPLWLLPSVLLAFALPLIFVARR